MMLPMRISLSVTPRLLALCAEAREIDSAPARAHVPRTFNVVHEVIFRSLYAEIVWDQDPVQPRPPDHQACCPSQSRGSRLTFNRTSRSIALYRARRPRTRGHDWRSRSTRPDDEADPFDT